MADQPLKDTSNMTLNALELEMEEEDEEEEVPLVKTASRRSRPPAFGNHKPTTAKASSMPTIRRLLAPVLVACLILSAVFLFSEEEQDVETEHVATKPPVMVPSQTDDAVVPDTTTPAKTPGEPATPVKQPDVPPPPSSHPKFGSLQEMKDAFDTATRSMMQQLEVKYGQDNFRAMFLKDGKIGASSLFKSINEEQNLGWSRMRRKMTIKILELLVQGNARFVWATGGHSAAASHGNFFNQSYTAYMESSVSVVMSAVGIDFEGRNYAVGGASSGPEIAFCSEAMFGKDVDTISWDFGMTDGDHFVRSELYFHRASLRETYPGLVLFSRGFNGARNQVMRRLEEDGAPTLSMDEKEFNQVLNKVPDTFGLTADQILAMPEYVRNMKCDGKIEAGDPFCSDEKFDGGACNDRMFRTSWHPGWRWHAVNGHLMALLLVELLEESFHDLLASTMDPQAILAQLTGEEKADRERLLHADLPEHASEFSQGENVVRAFYREPNFCHIALLPSEIRFKGILQESKPMDPLSLDVEYPSNKVRNLPNPSDEPRLVGEMRQRQVNCPIPLNIDQQDYFFASDTEGWLHLELPNKSELQEYGTGQPLQGLIAVCYVTCPWNNCPSGEIQDGVSENKVHLEVNGIAVEKLAKIGTDEDWCYLFHHTEGVRFQANEEGRFMIRMHVNEPNSYARFSSFIIW